MKQNNNDEINKERKYDNKDLNLISLNLTPSKIDNPYKIKTEKENQNNTYKKSVTFSEQNNFNTTSSNNYFYDSNKNPNNPISINKKKYPYDHIIPSINLLEKHLLDFKQTLRKDDINNYNKKYPDNNTKVNYNFLNLENKAESKPSFIKSNLYLFNNQHRQNQNTINHMEKERKYLILKNNELENEIKKLDLKLNENYKKFTKNPYDSLNNNKKNEENLSIMEQNARMRNQIKDLDKKINNLKSQIKNAKELCLRKEETNNFKSNTLLEIQTWKQRCSMLTDIFMKNLHDIKVELKKDKFVYKIAIREIKKSFENNINDMYKHYHNLMQKNEKNIKILQKEHSDLIEKEMKIKQVYLYNFSK